MMLICLIAEGAEGAWQGGEGGEVELLQDDGDAWAQWQDVLAQCAAVSLM